MAVNLSPVGGVAAQFFDNNGVILSGGKIYTYAAGTTTPVVTYTTSAGNVARTNPIVLDAAGRVSSGGEIWLTATVVYKFLLTDSNDVLIGTYDNISTQNNTDASLVTYTPAGTGAVTTTVQAKLRQTVSVLDFGADPTGVADSTTAIQNAINSGGRVYAPVGTYRISNTLSVPDALQLYGDGIGKSIFSFTASSKSLFTFAGHDNCSFIGLEFLSTLGQESATPQICFDLYASTGLSERNIIIEECYIHAFSESGIYLSSQWNIVTRNCVIEYCGSRASGVSNYTGGIAFKQDGTLTGWSGSGNSFNDTYFSACSYGIYNDSGWDVNVNNCILEYNTYSYVKSDNGSAMILNNCWLEGNTNPPVIRGPVIIIGGNNEVQTGDVSITTGTDAMLIVSGKGIRMLTQTAADLVNISPGGSVYTAIGVKFPATQVTSSDVNTLDDYEEGTWTPTLTSFGGTGLTTSGVYTKIGNSVNFSVIISGTSLTSTAGTSYFNMPTGVPVGSFGAVASIMNRDIAGPSYGNGLINFVDNKLYTSAFGPVSSVLVSGHYQV